MQAEDPTSVPAAATAAAPDHGPIRPMGLLLLPVGPSRPVPPDGGVVPAAAAAEHDQRDQRDRARGGEGGGPLPDPGESGGEEAEQLVQLLLDFVPRDHDGLVVVSLELLQDGGAESPLRCGELPDPWRRHG